VRASHAVVISEPSIGRTAARRREIRPRTMGSG
jgi:hypothetical protein